MTADTSAGRLGTLVISLAGLARRHAARFFGIAAA
jgi:hypothetical protein